MTYKDYSEQLSCAYDLPQPTEKTYYDPNLSSKSILNTNIESTKQLDSLGIIIKKGITEKKIPLIEDFNKSFSTKKELFQDISYDKIFSDFLNVLDIILLFAPNHISVGVSDDECVFIYAEFINKSMFLDLFFEKDEATEVLLNIKEDRKLIYSYVSELNKSLSDKLKEYLPEFNHSKYGLSNTFAAEYQQ